MFLANGRTERGHYIAFRGLISPCPPPIHSLTGPLNPLPPCLSKIKSRPTRSYRTPRALPLKSHVPSTIASGVVCWEGTDGGSPGSRVHVPLSSLPVSGTDICAGYLTHLSQRRAQCFGHLHSSCLGIPLPRMDTWAHLCTYVMTLCRPSLRSQNLLPVCFLAIISLERMFDWGGEQLAMYCGPDLGELIIITLNKYVRLTTMARPR